MRVFLFTGLFALVLVAALVYTFRKPILRSVRPPPPRSAPEAPPDAPPERLPEVAERVRKLRHAPETQRILLEFVRDAVRLGSAAVPDLRARLRDEPDVQFQPIWTFEAGRVRGFPTLRSAYLAALLEIPGTEAHDALIEALASTSSVRETYQIAAGLDRRGEGGFTAPALGRAQKASPEDVALARDLVALAARADPEGTAAEIALGSPRGEDATDPATLALALGMLPMERAVATGRSIIADPQVTPKAKERYLQTLCDRGEPGIVAALREVVNEGLLDRDLRVTMAYRAIGSDAFRTDLVEYARAVAEGQAIRAAEVRARYEARLREVELLLDAAVPPGRESALVRDNLLSRLEAQRSKLR